MSLPPDTCLCAWVQVCLCVCVQCLCTMGGGGGGGSYALVYMCAQHTDGVCLEKSDYIQHSHNLFLQSLCVRTHMWCVWCVCVCVCVCVLCVCVHAPAGVGTRGGGGGGGHRTPMHEKQFSDVAVL